jgi:hypothetical protein
MRGFLHLLRSVFISIELTVAGLLSFVWWQYPQPFAWTDKAIEKLEWIPLLGGFGALIVFATGLYWKILFPTKNASALCQWPKYPQLRTTTSVGLVFVAGGAVAGVAGVLGRGTMYEGLPSLLLIAGYAGAGVATLSMLLAAVTVRSITAGGH